MSIARRIAAKVKRIHRANKRSGLLNRLFQGARPGATPRELFGDVDDETWLWMNTEGRRESEKLRGILPGLPEEEMQRNFTGVTGDETLHQAFNYYALIKRYAQANGKPIANSDFVLDFGCGWGRIVRFFLRELDGSRIVGVDCYPSALEAARRTNNHCRFELIDPMPPSQLEGETFDVIYSYSVFSHLSEEAHERWLGEFHRLLKPGGLMFATTRQRDFISLCERIRVENRNSGDARYLDGPAGSFLDVERSLADYDSGKFCYSPVGGGGPLDKSFYGETAIPKKYVLDRWTERFQFVDFVNDPMVCDQSIIVVKK